MEDLTSLLRRVIAASKLDVFTVLTGTVESFNEGPPALADVRVGTRRAVVDDDDTIAYEELPILPACRVVFPGGNGVSMRWDLRKGDPCVVLVTTSNDANFWTTGKPADAGDERVHHPGSALVLAGFDLDVPQAPGLGVMRVSRGGSAQPVAKAPPSMANWEAIKTAVATAAPSGSTATPADAAAAAVLGIKNAFAGISFQEVAAPSLEAE